MNLIDERISDDIRAAVAYAALLTKERTITLP